MQFKHPEILYAFVLLIIPIIIHLFQLQRFKKIAFTNVAFLKKIEQQTRKSSKLKKWLLLATRILAFTALILAFAQPFFSENKKQQKQNLIVYLDNSLSMQAKGNDGELLKRNVQDIIENLNPTTEISLITNTKIWKQFDIKNNKNTLLNIKYQPEFKDFKTVLLQAKQLSINKTSTLNKVILLSDFQLINRLNKNDFTNVNTNFYLINTKPNSIQNFFVDSLAIKNKTNTEVSLKVFVNSNKLTTNKIPVSLFNNSILIGKSSLDFSKSKVATTIFKVPFSEEFNGKIVLDDTNLRFDNTFYFSLSKPKKIKVLSIGNKSPFLAKIYSDKEFLFKQKKSSQLDYNSMQNMQLIILNELTQIPQTLSKYINSFISKGGSLVIIPPKNAALNSYQQLFNNLHLGNLKPSEEKNLKITNINYQHPLLKDVFEKKVQNFQYPSIKIHYNTKLRNATKIISLENSQPFVTQQHYKKGLVYWFSSPLNTNVSSFSNSPLIVPLFYNFATHSFQPKALYYIIGKENIMHIKTVLHKDDVLHLSNDEERFIPLQQTLQNNVQITTIDKPNSNGFYNITKNNKKLATVAFNYNTNESILNYTNINKTFKDVKNVHIFNSVTKAFTAIDKETKVRSYFKYLLGLAFLFLIIEMLILKFYKP